MRIVMIGLLLSIGVTTSVSAQSETVQDAADAVAEEATETAIAVPPPISMSPSTSAPSPKSGFWRIIKVADYPIEAWQNDEEGTVRYRLRINEKGRVSACSITESSQSRSLDKATCELIFVRARFDPARDGNGEPIVGTYEGEHNWRKRESEMPDFAVRFDFVNTVAGEAIDCKMEILRGEMPDGLKRQIERSKERNDCGAMAGRRGVPYRDENGVPVEKRVSVTIDIALEDVD